MCTCFSSFIFSENEESAENEQKTEDIIHGLKAIFCGKTNVMLFCLKYNVVLSIYHQNISLFRYDLRSMQNVIGQN